MPDVETNHRLASDFLAGLVDGDWQRMRSALHPSATWTVPGEAGISGAAEGVDAVLARARAVHASDVSIQLQHILDGFTDVALLLHNTGQRGDVRLDEQVVVVLTVEGGKIMRADNLISDVPGLTAFFAAGS